MHCVWTRKTTICCAHWFTFWKCQKTRWCWPLLATISVNTFAITPEENSEFNRIFFDTFVNIKLIHVYLFTFSLIEHFGGKQLVMQLLSHEDPNVRYEALVAVQKLMVHNWYVLMHVGNCIDWNDIRLICLGSIWANNCKRRTMVAAIKLAVVVQPQSKEKPKWIYEQRVQWFMQSMK